MQHGLMNGEETESNKLIIFTITVTCATLFQISFYREVLRVLLSILILDLVPENSASPSQLPAGSELHKVCSDCVIL